MFVDPTLRIYQGVHRFRSIVESNMKDKTENAHLFCHLPYCTI